MDKQQKKKLAKRKFFFPWGNTIYFPEANPSLFRESLVLLNLWHLMNGYVKDFALVS